MYIVFHDLVLSATQVTWQGFPVSSTVCPLGDSGRGSARTRLKMAAEATNAMKLVNIGREG
jgi:hypothetical protein